MGDAAGITVGVVSSNLGTRMDLCCGRPRMALGLHGFFLPWTSNTSATVKKSQTRPCWRAIHKVSENSQSHLKQGSLRDCRRQDDEMSCQILNWITERKRVMGIPGERNKQRPWVSRSGDCWLHSVTNGRGWEEAGLRLDKGSLPSALP